MVIKKEADKSKARIIRLALSLGYYVQDILRKYPLLKKKQLSFLDMKRFWKKLCKNPCFC